MTPNPKFSASSPTHKNFTVKRRRWAVGCGVAKIRTSLGISAISRFIHTVNEMVLHKGR